jgi:hypothetical protein
VPVTTYKLAIGDRMRKIDDNRFQLIQSDVTITREPDTFVGQPPETTVAS